MNFQEFVTNNFASLSDTMNGSSELFHNKIRKESYASFQKSEFPSLRTEEWKFTNVRGLVNTEFELGNTNSSINVRDYILPDFDGSVLVFINGQFIEGASEYANEGGLEISNLSTALASDNADLKKGFNSLVDSKNIFSEINSSLYQDGAFIKVQTGKIIEKPILLLYLTDAESQNTVSFPRNFISVEKDAQVKVIEKYNTVGENKSLSTSITEIFVDERAICDHYKIQTDIDTASHIGTTNVRQKASSVFSNYVMTLSGDIIRNDLNVTQDGEHIETHMIGLYMLSNKTHVDNHTSLDLLAPHSYSNEFYKGILDDRSHGVFNGKIFVRKEAQKTNAFQTNNNLLLSDDAKINTKPQLEIWADDVKCSHGATTGQLDNEALFYLKARGIGDVAAKALLLRAFAGEITDKIKIDSVRTYLESLIETKLNA